VQSVAGTVIGELWIGNGCKWGCGQVQVMRGRGEPPDYLDMWCCTQLLNIIWLCTAVAACLLALECCRLAGFVFSAQLVLCFFVGCVNNGVSYVNNTVSCVNNRVGCVNNTVSCVNNTVSCVNNRVSCVNNIVGCVNNTVSCVNNTVSCVNNTVSCVNNRVSCVNNTVSCVNNRVSVQIIYLARKSGPQQWLASDERAHC
jgi:hypothetical protein